MAMRFLICYDYIVMIVIVMIVIVMIVINEKESCQNGRYKIYNYILYIEIDDNTRNFLMTIMTMTIMTT